MNWLWYCDVPRLECSGVAYFVKFRGDGHLDCRGR